MGSAEKEGKGRGPGEGIASLKGGKGSYGPPGRKDDAMGSGEGAVRGSSLNGETEGATGRGVGAVRRRLRTGGGAGADEPGGRMREGGRSQRNCVSPAKTGNADAASEERKARRRKEAELLERIRREDDPRAKEEFFERYRELLHRFAHRYHSDRLPYEDAFQLAALGMWKAVSRFDPSRGISFITFAYPTIEGELKKHYRDHLELIRMPRPLRDLRHRLEAERRAMEQEGLRPDVPLLAERLGVSEEEIIEVLAAHRCENVFSLDHVCGDQEEGDTLGSLVGEHDPAFEEVERELVLEEGLSRLPHRHRLVLEMRLRKGMTQSRIARELKISQMHVSRLIREAVEILAETCGAEYGIA